MRCDQPPFTDPRVRQAIALTLNRPQIVTALFKGQRRGRQRQPVLALVPLHGHQASAQRVQNIAMAKSAAVRRPGNPNGFTTALATENIQEIPEFAQIVAQSAAAIGVKINLNVEAQSKYYGNFEFGGSDWLDGTMSLVDYGHRGVPNVFLTAPLGDRTQLEDRHRPVGTPPTSPTRRLRQAGGPVRLRRRTLSTQKTARRADRAAAAQRDTPIIYPYFYNYLDGHGHERVRRLPRPRSGTFS